MAIGNFRKKLLKYGKKLLTETNCFLRLPKVRHLQSLLLVHDFYSYPHIAAHHELILLRRGRMTLQLPGESECQAGIGDLMVLRAGQLHADIFDKRNPLEQFFIHFDWDETAAAEFFRVVNPQLCSRLPPHLKMEIATQLHSLEGGLLTDFSSDLVAARLFLVLMLIYQYAAVKTEPSRVALHHRHLIHAAENYILANLHLDLTLDHIAAYLQVSKFHLSRVFKKHTGNTLHNYLTAMRMQRAEELLNEGRLHIAGIAAATGFNDVEYFGRVFKKYFKRSPVGKPEHGRKPVTLPPG